MGKINESLFVLKEQLKEEKDERNLKIRELQKNTEAELSSQRKFNEGTYKLTQNSITKHSTTSSRAWATCEHKWMPDSQARTKS